MLAKMSGNKLLACIEKLNAESLRISREFVNAGYGHYRGSDIRELAKNKDLTGNIKKLCAEYVTVNDKLSAANDERFARNRWHGSLKPIKRAI